MKLQHVLVAALTAVGLPFSGIGQEHAPIKASNLTRVARLTGNTLPNEQIQNSNKTVQLYDIGGTDLGIAWDMGNRKTGFWFGDTYGSDWKTTKEGGPGQAGNWRSNVVGISSDEKLGDGITFDSMISKEIIPSPHITDGTGNHTTIPTAAIRAGGKDYVHYMEIRKWGTPGNWDTNKSGLYQSKNNGMKWDVVQGVTFGGDSNFAQVAFAKKDGYVYMLGTQSGRWGAIYLARIREKEIENKAAYSYWNKANGWVDKESEADIVIPAPAGEMSIIWHTDFKRWIVTYLHEERHELVMRSAKNITGPWSAAETLVKATEYPGLYGAFIHPQSASGNNLYFLMSMWHPYNVFLMRVELSE